VIGDFPPVSVSLQEVPFSLLRLVQACVVVVAVLLGALFYLAYHEARGLVWSVRSGKSSMEVAATLLTTGVAAIATAIVSTAIVAACGAASGASAATAASAVATVAVVTVVSLVVS
jgi:hypothetical protein